MTQQIVNMVFLADGTRQKSLIHDLRLSQIIHFKHTVFPLEKSETFFNMKNKYDLPQIDQDLIIEGSPPGTRYIFIRRDKIKIIDCQEGAAPAELNEISKNIQSRVYSHEDSQISGIFVMVDPLGDSAGRRSHEHDHTAFTYQEFTRHVAAVRKSGQSSTIIGFGVAAIYRKH